MAMPLQSGSTVAGAKALRQKRCTFEELKAFLQKTKKMKPEDVKAIAELTELYIRERVAATKKEF